MNYKSITYIDGTLIACKFYRRVSVYFSMEENMKKRNLMEELNMMLANAMKENRTKLFRGRPDRDMVINEEDELNLKIALNSSKSLDEFLAKV